MARSLSDIAQAIGATLFGPDRLVHRVAPLEEAGDGDLSLCVDRRWIEALHKSKASAVLLSKSVQDLIGQIPASALLVEHPRQALGAVLNLLYPQEVKESGILPGAFVDPSAHVSKSARVEIGAIVQAGATIGANTVIEAGAVVGEGASIGENCRIGARTVVNGCCQLGDRVLVKPGAVLGADGFGFCSRDGKHLRIPQIGRVVIEDDVEIGACTMVDRATLGETRIGAGTKIDNLVQVGHNVQIGRRVLIAAQVGISGSARIEDGAILGGQVGVADHVVIGAQAQVGAQSGVGTRVEPKARVVGYPAIPVDEWLQQFYLNRRALKKKGIPGEKRKQS